MQILGFQIISDAELRKRISEAKAIERRLNNVIISRLLYNAESYRKKCVTLIRKVGKGGKN